MGLKFEWDKIKAEVNVRKHGVGFEEAVTVFGNPLSRIFYDEEHSSEEEREIIIGYSIKQRLLLVCFTERSKNVIRIFSARPATKKERKSYEENISFKNHS